MDTLAKNYWDNRYSKGQTSGYGSYGEQLMKKLKWLSGLNIKSISEIGCGDFNFGRNLVDMYRVPYIGQDVSSVIIEKNQRENEEPGLAFTTDLSELPPADLLLCVDVLFHVLDDKELEKLLGDIENKWIKYLAITAYERDEDYEGHVRIRKFDYKRFGEPIIREIVEEDGQLYFYLFKKSIDLRQVSCCLNTKEKIYPQVILDHIAQFPFGEVLIRTESDSPYRKHELFAKAKYDLLYYQDDDAICPIKELVELSNPEMINVAMKEGHAEAYKNRRMAVGFGWGSIFPKSVLKALDKYREKYGEDELFKRDTEKILTQLVYPQNRFVLPITDLPSAYNPDRLWRQPNHWSNMTIIEERCVSLIR